MWATGVNDHHDRQREKLECVSANMSLGMRINVVRVHQKWIQNQNCKTHFQASTHTAGKGTWTNQDDLGLHFQSFFSCPP